MSTGFDLLVVVLLGLSTVLGMWRGFVREVFAVLSWGLAIYMTRHYSNWMVEWLSPVVDSVYIRELLSLILVFLVVFFIMRLLGMVCLPALLVRPLGLGFWDGLLGGIFGMVRGILISVLLSAIILRMQWVDHDWWRLASVRPVLTWVVDNYVYPASPFQLLLLLEQR